MSKIFQNLEPEHQEFIKQQKIFFVGTAMAQGRLNMSPKGMDSLRIINDNRVIWLNMTGSGNETATHVLRHPRMTIMFCAFEGKPLILRLYGEAKVYHSRDPQWEEYINNFPFVASARQVFDVDISMVQTSCGFGIPFMEFKGERGLMKDWALKKGPRGVKEYWEKKNITSLDGFETGIF